MILLSVFIVSRQNFSGLTDGFTIIKSR